MQLSSSNFNVTESSTPDVYLAGSSLTINCDIDIPVSVNTPFSVLMEWTRDGVPAFDHPRVNATAAMETFPNHYQTQLVFSTLSNSEDTGEYTCAIAMDSNDALLYVSDAEEVNETVEVEVQGMPVLHHFVLMRVSCMVVRFSCRSNHHQLQCHTLYGCCARSWLP